jgi:hypothetical protein
MSLRIGGDLLERLFPSPVDNRVRGHPFALWLFCLITLITIVRSCIHIFRGDGGAQSIATIPLDAFTPDGAASLIAIFAQWGLSQLVIGLLFVVVAVRYRSLLSLMYVLLLVEYVGRIAIGAMKPVVTLETPPGGPASIGAIVVSLVGLVLSLRWKDEPVD